MGNIPAAIDKLKLNKGDFLYLDILSNASFMGTNEDGLQVPPVKDGQKRWWHVTGSLAACPKPRIKKILALFEPIRKIAGDATLVCGLPLPCYITEKCCPDNETLRILATMTMPRSSARQVRLPRPVWRLLSQRLSFSTC